MTDIKEILILGNQSSGKTLFLTRLLSNYNYNLSKVSTIPTTGTELHTIQIQGIDYNVREVGGLMSSQWISYIEHCSILLYVIDLTDLGSIASTIVLFHEIFVSISNIKANSHKSIPFAIVFNKNDTCDPMAQIICDNFLNNEIEYLNNANINIEYFCGCSIADKLILAVQDWIINL